MLPYNMTESLSTNDIPVTDAKYISRVRDLLTQESIASLDRLEEGTRNKKYNNKKKKMTKNNNNRDNTDEFKESTFDGSFGVSRTDRLGKKLIDAAIHNKTTTLAGLLDRGAFIDYQDEVRKRKKLKKK